AVLRAVRANRSDAPGAGADAQEPGARSARGASRGAAGRDTEPESEVEVSEAEVTAELPQPGRSGPPSAPTGPADETAVLPQIRADDDGEGAGTG
ncbi:hypothetical protein GTY54_25925, partial [Streptomyces sp. SID625]|nr:hypothetical protein [Streptomyces sp. SID625]